MNLASAVVKQTEGQLDQSASTLQSILVSAADERGEWHLPLTQEQSHSMQQVHNSANLFPQHVPGCTFSCRCSTEVYEHAVGT